MIDRSYREDRLKSSESRLAEYLLALTHINTFDRFPIGRIIATFDMVECSLAHSCGVSHFPHEAD